jgi:hypothetical protein
MDRDQMKLPRRLALDLQALREETRRALPRLDETERALRLAMMARRAPGGPLMRMLETLRSRPRFTGSIFACTLAVALLFLPVSYDRTVGHVVTVHVPGGVLDSQTIGPLARSMKKSLHADSVQVRAEARGEKSELTFIAKLPQRSSQKAEQLTQDLLQTLQQQNLHATAEVTARKERTAGRVYAMALDSLIRIHVDTTGKSDDQVADEIRNQLESSGVHGPSVTFERHGDESQMQISADVDGRQLQVMRKTKDATHDAVDVEIGGIDDKREPGMTDEQLRDKISRQLTARGITGTVTVTGDRIEIRVHKALETP